MVPTHKHFLIFYAHFIKCFWEWAVCEKKYVSGTNSNESKQLNKRKEKYPDLKVVWYEIIADFTVSSLKLFMWVSGLVSQNSPMVSQQLNKKPYHYHAVH